MAGAAPTEQHADTFIRSDHKLLIDGEWVEAAMPFGGYKESGWGREMGQAVLNNYLETKSVVTAL